jgi:hypothetical protein
MSNILFYQTRVDEALLAADQTTLANVRERCLRAAAAWGDMAERAARIDRHRVEDALRKAERDEAAALAAPAIAFAGGHD